MVATWAAGGHRDRHASRCAAPYPARTISPRIAPCKAPRPAAMARRLHTAIEHRRRIRGAVHHLALRLRDTPWAWPTLDELADAACMSPFHFLRAYAQATGETPQTTTRRLKLEAARAALSTADRLPPRVQDVAMAQGYDSPQAFCRAYRQQFGRVPSAAAPCGEEAQAQAWVMPLPGMAFQSLALPQDDSGIWAGFDEMMGHLDVAGVPRFGQDMYALLTPDLALSHACALQNRWVDRTLRLVPVRQPAALHLCISGPPAAVWRRWRDPLVQQARRDDAPVLMRYLNDPAYRVPQDRRIELYVALGDAAAARELMQR